MAITIALVDVCMMFQIHHTTTGFVKESAYGNQHLVMDNVLVADGCVTVNVSPNISIVEKAAQQDTS